MTRDYRHGPARPRPYQRRSQQAEPDREEARRQSKGGSMRLGWLALVVTAALLGAYWVVTHFAQQGVKSENVASVPADDSISDKSAPETATGMPETAVSETPEPTTPEADNDDQASPSESGDKVVEALPNPHVAQAVPEDNDVTYTFYHGLAEAEVVVDAMPLPVALAVPHYIQAGSFGAKRYALAEQKRLQRHGQALVVSELTTERGTYYRLRMGPFKDRLALNKQRNALRRLGVDTLVIRDQADQ